MRLNRKREILRYLGKSENNWRAWALVKRRYATAIYRLSPTNANGGYWALSEELDAIDREKGAAVAECECGNMLHGVTTYRHHRQRARGKGAIQ